MEWDRFFEATHQLVQRVAALEGKIDSLRRSIDGDDTHPGLRERIRQIERTLEQLEAQQERRRSGVWEIVTAIVGAAMGAITGYFASKAGG